MESEQAKANRAAEHLRVITVLNIAVDGIKNAIELGDFQGAAALMVAYTELEKW